METTGSLQPTFGTTGSRSVVTPAPPVVWSDHKSRLTDVAPQYGAYEIVFRFEDCTFECATGTYHEAGARPVELDS